ncbi:hypothetical protein JG687_00013044 [Phytophthora cactorum]|uniref:Uncharacterized protein n=1 Tax=Phytophthora cactorum TaxID=29920 RepID=A0A8T1U0D7_9STRA|nr:hypothetical protein JG687_00013044 [Phytophthora cactorum]
MAAMDLPAIIRLLTSSHNEVPTKRLLRAHGTTNDDNEERVNIGGLIQAGTSRLDDLATSAKLETYELLVKNLQLGDDFVASLN